MHSRVHTLLTMPGTQLTTGQLGAVTGVSADTIRHYEKLGLLKKAMRSVGGYRLYDADAITRVQTIRSAVKAGFTLSELSGIFTERDAGGAPCRRVAALAADKIELLELRIRELTDLKQWLASTVESWQERLDRIPPGKRAGLLESLGEQPSLDGKALSKGTNHEGAHPFLRPLRGSKRAGSNNHGMPNARPTPNVR
jgi:DNA-binding transcriptional MerR regulator